MSGPAGVFETMVRFFREDDWKFRQIEGETILLMGFQGENGRWQMIARARDPEQQLIIFSVLEEHVAEERRPAMAEFVARANYGMIIGNFELDFSDGEVRYKTSIDVEGGELTTGMVKRLVYANVLMMDKYLPGIVDVMQGRATPAEAVSKIES